MNKPQILLLISLFLLATHPQTFKTAPCPLHYTIGSVISARITIAQDRGIIPLVRGQDVQCYNYSLSYPFARVPEAAIAIHDFDALKTDDLFFSVKPVRTESLSYLPLLVRTHWKYTSWKKISFSVLVEDRQDVESGYYQIDSGVLGGCEAGKTIHVLLPFRSINAQGSIPHNVFLQGFEISSQLYAPSYRSPFEIQIVHTATNSSGIAVFFSVTTITQVHAIHVSYVAWWQTDLHIVSGKYTSNILNGLEISHIPEQNIGRNYARIFGLSGFIINHQDQDIYFSTIWSGSKYTFDFDSSTPYVKYLSFQYLFWLGSECSDCPNYPYIFNATCWQFCPEGSHATDDKVCIDCGEGHYWNGTICVKECPKGQFLNLNNQCQCPLGLYWNGVVCLNCLGGKIFNTEKNICECPEGTRWNGYGCATVQVCTHGRTWNVFKFTCECPLESFWNGTFCVRATSCKDGLILDEKTNKCVCPEGTHWNGKWCQANGCKGGQIWNGKECVCEEGFNFNGYLCLLCINGQEWNPKTKTCDCPLSYVWNGNYCERKVNCTGNRVWNASIKQCICPNNEFWNGFSCMVRPQCCCGKIWNETSLQCNCPESFNWDGSACVLCLNGKRWDESKKVCDCREGTQWNGHFCVVIQNCFGGMIWNQNTWACQCPSITVWNGRYCTANPCKGGQFWNAEKRKCECPTGYMFYNGICTTESQICVKPRQWDPLVSRCVCPIGYWDNVYSCIPIPYCQGNQIRNPNTNECFCSDGLVWLQNKQSCSDPTCPVDQRWDGLGCVEISCPPNSYYNGTQCICPDPKDYCQPWQYFDGVKCVYQPGSCPEGTNWNGTFCIPNNTCPVGFYSVGSSCEPLPQRCVPPTQWMNGRCQVSNSCPHGTYFRSGNCIPYIGCQNGQTWSNSLVNCVCPEGTEWNGDKCLACSGGKSWQPFVGCQCPTGYFFSGARCQKATENRCKLIPNSFWDGLQCLCHEGFEVVGMQCICDGVEIGDRCDRCAHRPNSEWKYGQCRCKVGYTLYGTECLANQAGNNTPDQCNVGTFYDSQQRKCLPCPAGCLSCESSYVCLSCRPQFNYDSSSQLCTQHCGDGKRFVLGCDDGNNADGDGCSFSCEVQPGYICRGGSPNAKDSCVVYVPKEVTLIQTGQIRYSTKIIVNIKLDYLPKDLLQSSDCNDRCSNVLDGEVKGSEKPISVRSSYLSGTTYSFSVQIDFGRSYIGLFTLEVRINPEIGAKYFGNVGTNEVLKVEVNPAYLSKVNQEQL